jgi:hypothetical protein
MFLLVGLEYKQMDKDLILHLLRETKKEGLLIKDKMLEHGSEQKIASFLERLVHQHILQQKTMDENFKISREQRAQLALEGIKNGLVMERIIHELTWQEFEILTTKVGSEFGYYAFTGLNFSDKERKYQIDVILKKKPYVLFIDCKHFGGTGKQSVLKKAAEEQIERVQAVGSNIEQLVGKLQITNWPSATLIPVIITWLDDAVFFHKKVPVIPFTRLRSFFNQFYVYFEDIYQLQVTILEH